MKAKEFQDKARETFLKYFPNGYFRASGLCLGGGVHLAGGLIASATVHTPVIRSNDPLNISIFIHDGIKYNDEETDLGDLVLEFDHSTVSVNPDNPNFYAQSHKIKARKIKGDPVKVLAALDKYYKRAKEEVQEQAALNRIKNQDQIDSKYFD